MELVELVKRLYASTFIEKKIYLVINDNSYELIQERIMKVFKTLKEAEKFVEDEYDFEDCEIAEVKIPLKFNILSRSISQPKDEMKLITKEFIESFKAYPFHPYNDDYLREKDPMVVVKLHDPSESVSWYLTRYNQEDKTAYGFITGSTEDHFAYFSLAELEEDNVSIEMEIVNKRLSECLKDD